MGFEEIFQTVKKKINALDPGAFGPETIAYEFVLTGEGGGTFYALVKDGALSVKPCEYKDCSCRLTLSAPDFIRMLEGRLNPVVAFTLGKLKINGDIRKAILLADVIKRK